MSFVSKMMNFALKMMKFVFKMINFVQAYVFSRLNGEDEQSQRLREDFNLDDIVAGCLQPTEFFIGSHMSGAQVHRHGAAVNALVVGTKRWFLFPPWLPNWGHDAFGMEVSEWVERVLPSLRTQGIAPIELIQRSGMVVYVPPEWGHAVLNHGDVVGVSSQVFVDLAREMGALTDRLKGGAGRRRKSLKTTDEENTDV